ncbi:MAG: serine hydrolase [Symploca sp. SIO2B6]|nr:serine hydrolase [Symploca sp. SIO2B6]
MPFFHHDELLQQAGDRVLARTWKQFPLLARNQLALTWVVYDDPVIVNTGGAIAVNDFWQQSVRGFSYRGVESIDPAEIVHLVYLIAIHDWREQGMVPQSNDLDRAMDDMIRLVRHDAASLVVDILTGTTSGPALPPQPFQTWQQQRNLINRYLRSLQWPELETANVNQKTWTGLPYGREYQSLGTLQENRNTLTTDAIARLMHSIVGGVAVSPKCSQSMMASLYQLPLSFLASSVPPNTRYWSLVGQNRVGPGGQASHEVAYIEIPNAAPFLVALTIQPKETSQALSASACISFLGQQMISELENLTRH